MYLADAADSKAADELVVEEAEEVGVKNVFAQSEDKEEQQLRDMEIKVNNNNMSNNKSLSKKFQSAVARSINATEMLHCKLCDFMNTSKSVLVVHML